MSIRESCLTLTRVDSHLQRILNRTWVLRIENAHETRIAVQIRERQCTRQILVFYTLIL